MIRIYQKTCQYFNLSFLKLVHLNLYKTRSNDATVIKKEILSTRLYLVSLIVGISILTVYTSSSLQEKTGSVAHPSEVVYKQLLESYSDAVTCTCQQISIQYMDIIEIVPTFHQVCMSEFISQEWIDFTFNIDRSTLWPMDIRTTLSHVFQLLRFLCNKSVDIFSNALEGFLDQPLISLTLLSPESLQKTCQFMINTLQQTANNNLLRPFTFMHSITNVRELMNGLSTNYILRLKAATFDQNIVIGEVLSVAYVESGSSELCYCMSGGFCPVVAGIYSNNITDNMGIYDLNEIVPIHKIPGFLHNCLPLQIMLTSTLECFYNQTCLNILISSYPTFFNITILDSQQSSSYQVTTTIEQLLNNSFIENLSNQTKFSSYYDKCAPKACSYRYLRRFDWMYVLGILISLFGGLNTLFHISSPNIIAFIYYLKSRRNRPHVIEVEGTSSRTNLKILIKTSFVKILKAIIEFNLFTKKTRTAIRLKRGRIASRLFVLLLILSSVILVFYVSIPVQTFNEIVENPSEEEYTNLQTKYPNTVKCPCSVIGVSYERIINFRPVLHQVCSSDFIQPSWYETLGITIVFEQNLVAQLAYSSPFRTLSLLCELSKMMIHHSIAQFHSNFYINAHTVPKESFDSEMKTVINKFMDTTIHDSSYTMELVDAVIQANLYIVGISQVNTAIYAFDLGSLLALPFDLKQIVTVDISEDPKNASHCSCILDKVCYIGSFIDYTLFGCSTMSKILNIPLEPLYNAEFMEQMKQQFTQSNLSFPTNTKLLDPNVKSRFPIMTKVQSIFNELMIEDWDTSISYSEFYQGCRPIRCSFSYQARPNALLLISILSGILGGLRYLLKLICPILIRIIIQDKVTHTEPVIENIRRRDRLFHYIHSKLQQIKEFFITLNIFDDEDSNNNSIFQERLSTWMYIILLAAILAFTLVYTVLTSYRIDLRMTISSLEEYENFTKSQKSPIICPCSKIATKYGEFVDISVNLHQVCSSDFIKRSWAVALFESGFWFVYDTADIRIRGFSYFSFLSQLCNLSNATLTDAIEQFLDQKMVTSYLSTENEFYLKLNFTTDRFKTTTPIHFNDVLQLLTSITHGNAFITTFLMNWYWDHPLSDVKSKLTALPTIFDDECSCGTRADCSKPGGIFRSFGNQSVFQIPGLRIGCSSVQTVLQSSLECFYNDSCIESIIFHASETYVRLYIDMYVQPLNPELESRYTTQMSIGKLVENLFIEKWKTNVSYSAYYNQCDVEYCTYSIEKQHESTYIISVLLSVYGGSTAVLRVASPLFARILIRLHERLRYNIIRQ